MTRPSGSSDAAAPTDSPAAHIDAPPSAPVDEKGKGKAIKSDDCMEEVDDDEEDDEDDGDDDDEAEDDDEMDDVSVFRAIPCSFNAGHAFITCFWGCFCVYIRFCFCCANLGRVVTDRVSCIGG